MVGRPIRFSLRPFLRLSLSSFSHFHTFSTQKTTRVRIYNRLKHFKYPETVVQTRIFTYFRRWLPKICNCIVRIHYTTILTLKIGLLESIGSERCGILLWMPGDRMNWSGKNLVRELWIDIEWNILCVAFGCENINNKLGKLEKVRRRK